MNDLSNSIYDYYLSHFEELETSKQFHFASRLQLWRDDEACQKLLINLRPWFTHGEEPEAAITDIISEASESLVIGSKNATELRRPYLERYPLFKTYVSVLYRITFLYTIYKIDCRPLFYKLFNRTEIETFAQALLADPVAISLLSTHAVNFFYLYYGMIENNIENNSLLEFLKSKRYEYNLEDPTQLQLMIYLFTHCIIGESLFYYRSLLPDRAIIYRKLIKELENLMSSRLEDINLDCKFEFLVSTKLIGYDSSLVKPILKEAEKSLSPDGNFLVDQHNNNPQKNNLTLDASEHRNVMFIMAFSSFEYDRRPNL